MCGGGGVNSGSVIAKVSNSSMRSFNWGGGGNSGIFDIFLNNLKPASTFVSYLTCVVTND